MARRGLLDVPRHEPRQARRQPGVRGLVQQELQGPAGQSDGAHAPDEPGDGRGRGDHRRGRRRARARRRRSGGGALMGAARIQLIEGRALPIRGEDMDTDRIMPARFLKAFTFDGLGEHVFEDDRLAAKRSGQVHPFDESKYQGAAILIANRNFGAGSSREHAPQGLHRWGIRAIVAESFAEIFFGNSLMMGLACVTASPTDVAALMSLVERQPQALLKVDLDTRTCQAPGMTVRIGIPDHVRDTLMTGAWDTTSLLLDRYTQVNAVSARLPY